MPPPLYQCRIDLPGFSRSILIDGSIAETPLQQLLANVAREEEWLVAHFRRSTVRTDRTGRTRTATAVSFDGAGYPDLTLARPGWACWAEVKSRTGRLKPDQARWRAVLQKPLPNGLPAWQLWEPTPSSLVVAFATIYRCDTSNITIKEHE